MHPNQFTSINDLSVVKALLDELKSSEAWQQTINQTVPDTGSSLATSSNPPSGAIPQHDTAPPTRIEDVEDHSELTSTSESQATPSVAALLSQLQSSASFASIPSSVPNVPPPPPQHVSVTYGAQFPSVSQARPAATPVQAPPAQKENMRHHTFQQALPHLVRMVDDPNFVATITAMKKEQTELERRLWEERRAIQRKHEEKVKVARTKAQMIGAAGLTQHEADTMSESFRKELQKFDTERALLAWDSLVTKQQQTLESLGVPTMFPTASMTDREKQQKVMHVLGGVATDVTR